MDNLVADVQLEICHHCPLGECAFETRQHSHITPSLCFSSCRLTRERTPVDRIQSPNEPVQELRSDGGFLAGVAGCDQIPNPLFRPKLQSTLPPGISMPETCRPICRSSAGRQGTS
jgi:hypothetical protein